MNLFSREARWSAAGAAALFLAGCASPGPPRSPSLRLPQPVADLTASRVGDVVELRFTAPWRSTDKLPLRAGDVDGVLCRALEQGACLPVTGLTGQNAVATAGPNGGRNMVVWRDPLPAALAAGPRRLLSYRVEFFSRAGRSAGKSEAAYSATGPAPPAVAGLRAEGSRLGIVLSWVAAAENEGGAAPGAEGTVLLRREDLAPADSARAAKMNAAGNPAKAGKHPPASVAWLDAVGISLDAAGAAGGQPNQTPRTLDATAEPDVPYRYSALRRLTVTLGGRSIELRSAASPAIDFTLHAIYPPPAPTGLTAAGYVTAPGQSTESNGNAEANGSAETNGNFAVDLIWQPVDAAGLIAPLVGYNVYRAALASGGAVAPGERERLNPQPVPMSAFRDITANPATGYRYFVTSVDSKGNESSAATTTLQPSQAP